MKTFSKNLRVTLLFLLVISQGTTYSQSNDSYTSFEEEITAINSIRQNDLDNIMPLPASECEPLEGFSNGGFETLSSSGNCTIDPFGGIMKGIENGIYEGCSPGWYSAHGSPDLLTSFDGPTPISPQSGSHFAGIITSNYNPNPCNNEAIFLEYDFTPGLTYELTFHHRAGAFEATSITPPLEVQVSLTSGLVNVSSEGAACSDLVLNDPITLFEDDQYKNLTWKESTVSFIAQEGQDQIVFVVGPVLFGPSPKRIWAIDGVSLSECGCANSQLVLDFHFENALGENENEFLEGESVIFDGTSSNVLEAYKMYVSRCPILEDGTVGVDQDECSLPWTNGPLGEFNLNTLMTMNSCFSGDDNIFESGEFGYVYKVMIADFDECDKWQALEKTFRVLPKPDCEELQSFINGSFENINLAGINCEINNGGSLPGISNAFGNGCVDGWWTAQGSPDLRTAIINDDGLAPIEAIDGDLFGVIRTSIGSGNQCRNEVIFQEYDFTPGITYELSFYHSVGITDGVSTPDIDAQVVLTSGLTNDPSTGTEPCDNLVLENSKVVFNRQGFSSGSWIKETVYFTAELGHNQIAFIPRVGTGTLARYWAVDDVKISDCDCLNSDLVIDFHIEDANGNDQDEFCPGEDVFINGMATNVVGSDFYIDMIRYPLLENGNQGPAQDFCTNTWSNVSPLGTFSLSQWATDLGCYNDDVIFGGGEFGYLYKVKIADKDECGIWRSQVQFFNVLPGSGTLEFHFEDEEGSPNDDFCFGQAIWVNGDATNETRYHLDIWCRDAGTTNEFDILTGFGWINQEFGPFNLTGLLAGQGLLLSPDKEYQVKVVIQGECFNWIPLTRNFTIGCCRATNAESDFEIIVPASKGSIYTLEATNYDLFANQNAIHEWYLFTSPDPNNGPFTPVLGIVNDEFVYTNAQDGVWYNLIHRVTTECGTTCYLQNNCRNCGGAESGCELCGPIDCRIIDEWWGDGPSIKRAEQSSTEVVSNGDDFLLFPNPVFDLLNISNPLNQTLTFALSDINGRTIAKGKLAALHTEQVNLETYAAGVYLVRIFDVRGTIFSTRLIVIKQ